MNSHRLIRDFQLFPKYSGNFQATMINHNPQFIICSQLLANCPLNRLNDGLSIWLTDWLNNEDDRAWDQEVESQTFSNQLGWSSGPASYSCLLIFFLFTSLSSAPFGSLIQIRTVITFWGRQRGHEGGKIRFLSFDLCEGGCVFLLGGHRRKTISQQSQFLLAMGQRYGTDTRDGGFGCPWMMTMMGRGKYLLTVRFLNGTTIIIILSAAGQKGRTIHVELQWEGRYFLWTRKDNGCPRVALEIILSCRRCHPGDLFRDKQFSSVWLQDFVVYFADFGECYWKRCAGRN